MYIVITRSGKCAGISTVIGSIDTRILTGAAENALSEALQTLSCEDLEFGADKVSYSIDIREDDGSHRVLTVADGPGNPWVTPIKRILNKAGMADRI